MSVDVLIGDVHKQVEFSLVSRRGMLNRILLGRAALMDNFLVDSAKRYLLGKPTVGDKS